MNKSIEEYFKIIQKKCEKSMPKSEKSEKISDYDIIVPTSENIDILFKYNYNKEQLKAFASKYKLKISGNKNELLSRIFCYLGMSSSVLKIQKIFRGHLQRRYNSCRGPGLFQRDICTNSTDFFTMDDISSLSNNQFFSYKDIDGFIYGFDIISLYNLIKKGGTDVRNPYNRNKIPKHVIKTLKSLVRLSKIYRIPMELNIVDIAYDIPTEKNVELRALDLFQSIDALGNYSMPQWFLSLHRNQLLKFTRELIDIWEYRAQLQHSTKVKICPPAGAPFSPYRIQAIQTETNMQNLQKYILEILEKLVNSGVDHEHKSLGAIYVLGALTLVNSQAAEALPWLYQSVHF
jgi:hypothetical protein